MQFWAEICIIFQNVYHNHRGVEAKTFKIHHVLKFILKNLIRILIATQGQKKIRTFC